MRLVRIIVAPLCVAALVACGAASDSGEEKDSGPGNYGNADVVHLVVGQEPGGGFDSLARLLQPSLEKALREETGTNVRVMVDNRPGGDNVVAAQYLYKAKPDGLTLYLASSERLTAISVEGEAQFDISRVTPLGIMGASNRGIIARKELKLSEPTFAALNDYSKSEVVRLASPGAGERLALLNTLLAEESEPTNFKHVSLNGGTSDLVASLLRGDVDAVMTTAVSLGVYVDDNPDEIEFIVSMGCEREPGLPDVPTLAEQNVPNAEKICQAMGSYERSFIGPPGLKGERLESLTSALKTALTEDADFKDKATRAGDPPSYKTPEEEAQLFESVAALYKQYEDVLQGTK